MLMAIRGGHGLLPVLLLAFLMCLAVIAAPTEPDSKAIQESSHSPSGEAVRTTVEPTPKKRTPLPSGRPTQESGHDNDDADADADGPKKHGSLSMPRSKKRTSHLPWRPTKRPRTVGDDDADGPTHPASLSELSPTNRIPLRSGRPTEESGYDGDDGADGPKQPASLPVPRPKKELNKVWNKFRDEMLSMLLGIGSLTDADPMGSIRLDRCFEILFYPFRATGQSNAIIRRVIGHPRIILFLGWLRSLRPRMTESSKKTELTIQVGTGNNVSNWTLERALKQLDDYTDRIQNVYVAWSTVVSQQELEALNRNTLFKGIILTFLRLRQNHNVVHKRETEEAMTTVMASLQDDLMNAHGVTREIPSIAGSWPFLLKSMRDHAESMGSGLAQSAPPKHTEVSGKNLKQLQSLADQRNSQIRDIGKQFVNLLNFFDESAEGETDDFDAQIAVYSLARSVFEWKVRYSDYGEPDNSKNINAKLVNQLQSSEGLGGEAIGGTLQQAVETNFGPKWSDIAADKTELLANLDDAIKDFNSFM
ncbi:hypothetical protein CXG81DRAFT_21541, partial [Caulochytrium protostelioides]